MVSRRRARAATEPEVIPELVTLMTGPQSDFFRCEEYHPALFSGRRGGKTVVSIAKAFAYSYEQPGALGVLTEPSYTKVRDILVPTMNAMFGKLRGSGEELGWEFHKGDMEVEFGNGSRILLRSADNAEFGRGLTLAWFGIDEAGESTNNGTQEEVFLILQPTLTQKGYPHIGWVTTTPRGPNHWLYRRWVRHETTGGEELTAGDYPFFFMETAENFHLDEASLRVMRESYGNSRWAEQELGGRFVAMEGLVFQGFSYDTHVALEEGPFVRRLAGLDWGLSSPTAMVLVGVTADKQPCVLDEFYRRNATVDDIEAKLLEWEVTRVFCDPTAKETIDDLRRRGFWATKAHSNSITDRVNAVQKFLTGPLTMRVAPQCINLIEELASLEYARAPGGTERTNDRFNPSQNDHAIDALSYACQDIGHVRGAPRQMEVVYV